MSSKVDLITKTLLDMCIAGHSNAYKSSYWEHYTKKFRFNKNKVSGISAFSPRSKRFPCSDAYHRLLQALNFEEIAIPTHSRWYKLAQYCSNKQNRSFDLDLLRQVFTLELLEDLLSLREIENICIIGDGQANFASLAIHSDSFRKIISINLPEVLLSDWELITLLDHGEGGSQVLTNAAEMDDFFANKKRFGMVQASDWQILLNQPIDLFVNIVSFGEMTHSSIMNYFKIIKSTTKGAFLYCCNRREKRLPGGEITRFSEYPWQGFSHIMLDEPCPWHQNLYATKRSRFFPFPIVRRPYDGIIDHRLVSYPSV